MPGQKTGPDRRIGKFFTLLLALGLLAGCASPSAGAVVADAGAISDAGAGADAAFVAAATPLPAPAATLPPDADPTALVAPQLYTYRVLEVFPHDPTAFTQGLIVRNGELIEGTGRQGESTLRRVAIETGEVLQAQALGPEYFGEGITELDGRIYQLTWQNGAGFIYDAQTLAPNGQFAYATEGWGITHDGARLIVSDGTPILQFWEPATLQPVDSVTVSLFGMPLANLNELEYIDGSVYANIWKTDLVVRIDPASGSVTGVIDLSGLLSYAPAPAADAPASTPAPQPDVLNGIAYDEASGRLFVTGKLWPAVFLIELLEAPPAGALGGQP